MSNDALVNSYDVLHGTRLVLGEGPAWNEATSEFSWIDIEDGLILVAQYTDGELGPVTTMTTGEEVGCAIPISGGRFLCGLRSQLAIVHRDGTIERSRDLIPDGLRFNDGKIDPQGRFVIGSLNRSGPDGIQQLVRLEHDGTVTVLDGDIGISNGVAWSPDGAWFYSADTVDGFIYRRAYVDGAAGDRELFIDLGGSPDGISTDMDGNIWVTVFDKERVDCFGRHGERIESKSIPTPGRHPSSVEFIGPGLSTMVITTGFPRIPEEDRYRTAGDGATLVLPAASPGVPTTPWAEIALPD